MPDNTINWGQGAVENTNDWGKGKTNSANNWGKVYETSPAGDTNIEGGLALSITYSASAYCDGIGDTPQPTVAGNTGSGTFSSTSGIIFADSGSNTGSSTGVIDVDASTKGATYVITYTDTDSDTATANVTLNALDNAAFTYSASSYEPTDADPTPTITGLTGGTFSSTSGLVFVDSGTNTGSSTGEIDLSASTIASYTITYDTTSSGSSVCPNTSTQSVEIALAGIANNYSMAFDGTNDYLYHSPNSIFNFGTGDFTISSWFKITDFSNYPYLLDFRFVGNAPENALSVYFYPTGKLEVYASGAAVINASDSTAISTGVWKNLILKRESGTLSSHFDGGSADVTASCTTNFNSTPPLYIGRRSPTNSQYLEGSIDEVAVWNTALTSTQISEIYSATGTNLTKDLTTVSGSNLVYWNRMGD